MNTANECFNFQWMYDEILSVFLICTKLAIDEQCQWWSCTKFMNWNLPIFFIIYIFLQHVRILDLLLLHEYANRFEIHSSHSQTNNANSHKQCHIRVEEREQRNWDITFSLKQNEYNSSPHQSAWIDGNLCITFTIF